MKNNAMTKQELIEAASKMTGGDSRNIQDLTVEQLERLIAAKVAGQPPAPSHLPSRRDQDRPAARSPRDRPRRPSRAIP